MKLRYVAAAAALAGILGTVGAIAADNPIETRKGVMKSIGAAIKATAPMVKGEAEYDAVKAELAMRVVANGAAAAPHLFPAGSETGGDTEASPKIWEDMAGFKAKADTFAADANAAVASAAGGLDAFKGGFMKLTGNCKDCHEAFRIKKQ
ncbi:MAG: cytochrome c [Hyphomicrobiales bacterium]